MVRAIARMVTYMALLATVVILPHWIAYTLVPEYAFGGMAFTECATEDSTNCYWNADVQGNGTGNSFIAGP